MGVPSFLSRAGRRNVSLYRGALAQIGEPPARFGTRQRMPKSSPRGNVSLRGSRASDSACRCSRKFSFENPSKKVLYYNHYTKENRNL